MISVTIFLGSKCVFNIPTDYEEGTTDSTNGLNLRTTREPGIRWVLLSHTDLYRKGKHMSKKQPIRYLALLLALGLVIAACSSDDSSDTTMAAGMDMDGESSEYMFGDPMEASDASRVIEITANDDFTFFPSGATVTKGETVTFRVTNEGKIPHDFVLGDAQMQDEHEEEMAEMDGDMAMHDEPNAFVLEPGETKEMTWHMTADGEVIYGCHQPGHYDAGMKGVVVVSG
jgi:uncharacterized cupredoxin-like copper-binding protein